MLGVAQVTQVEDYNTDIEYRMDKTRDFRVQAICDSFFLLFANLVYTGAFHISPDQG